VEDGWPGGGLVLSFRLAPALRLARTLMLILQK